MDRQLGLGQGAGRHSLGSRGGGAALLQEGHEEDGKISHWIWCSEHEAGWAVVWGGWGWRTGSLLHGTRPQTRLGGTAAAPSREQAHLLRLETGLRQRRTEVHVSLLSPGWGGGRTAGRDEGQGGDTGTRCSHWATWPVAPGARTRDMGTEGAKGQNKGHSLQKRQEGLAAPQKVNITTVSPSRSMTRCARRNKKTHMHTETGTSQQDHEQQQSSTATQVSLHGQCAHRPRPTTHGSVARL